ncbi:unnamed protein product [Effrenium voratum]|uniref:Uncharacterized protein n=1 Tax=Effrenium voratum TaxID=2562239 RepID=A0AA36NDN1_9DINO|nr:unnamed protein product [Effrenium voratum]
MDAERSWAHLCCAPTACGFLALVLVAYHNHTVPYFQSSQVGEFTKGFDFSHDGVRTAYGVAGQSTEIFYEGPEIERKVLERLHALPFEACREKYRPQQAALLRDFLRPYFGQRSATVKANDVLEIQGVKFKVISTRPTEGGGVGKDTELVCQGVALRESFQPAARSKAKASWQRWGGSLAFFFFFVLVAWQVSCCHHTEAMLVCLGGSRGAEIWWLKNMEPKMTPWQWNPRLKPA